MKYDVDSCCENKQATGEGGDEAQGNVKKDRDKRTGENNHENMKRRQKWLTGSHKAVRLNEG